MLAQLAAHINGQEQFWHEVTSLHRHSDSKSTHTVQQAPQLWWRALSMWCTAHEQVQGSSIWCHFCWSNFRFLLSTRSPYNCTHTCSMQSQMSHCFSCHASCHNFKVLLVSPLLSHHLMKEPIYFTVELLSFSLRRFSLTENCGLILEPVRLYSSAPAHVA